jgi:hypothetical protein
MKTLLTIFSLVLIVSCSTKKGEETYKLGQLIFDVTGKEKARPAFMKGHLLLHSFEYADAAEGVSRSAAN